MEKIMNKEISGNELGPCGSKKKYKRCCRKKDFTWARDEDGNICRVVSASDELIEEFHKSRKQFFDVFGRDSIQDDPLLLGKYLVSDTDYDNDLDQAMEAAGIDSAIAYACKKTGLLVSQQNINKLTDVEIEEWNDAITEFNNGSIEANPITSFITKLEANIEHLIFAYGLVLDKYANNIAPSTGPVEFMIKFHITKSMKVLRSIRLLTQNSMPDTVFALLRTMYESYIYILYALSNPKEAEEMLFATLGLDSGTYRYPLNADGSIKSKKIAIGIKSGKEVKLTINNYQVIKLTKSKSELEFYEMIYELLSKHVHPNLSVLDQCFDMNKFDHFISLHKVDGIVYTNAIAAIILEYIASNILSESILVNDVKHVVKDTRDKIINILQELDLIDGGSESRRILAQRIELFSI